MANENTQPQGGKAQLTFVSNFNTMTIDMMGGNMQIQIPMQAFFQMAANAAAECVEKLRELQGGKVQVVKDMPPELKKIQS